MNDQSKWGRSYLFGIRRTHMSGQIEVQHLQALVHNGYLGGSDWRNDESQRRTDVRRGRLASLGKAGNRSSVTPPKAAMHERTHTGTGIRQPRMSPGTRLSVQPSLRCSPRVQGGHATTVFALWRNHPHLPGRLQPVPGAIQSGVRSAVGGVVAWSWYLSNRNK